MKFIIFVLTAIIAGCATQPMPASLPPPPPNCDYKVAGKCRSASASDISGNTTLGNHNHVPITED